MHNSNEVMDEQPSDRVAELFAYAKWLFRNCDDVKVTLKEFDTHYVVHSIYCGKTSILSFSVLKKDKFTRASVSDTKGNVTYLVPDPDGLTISTRGSIEQLAQELNLPITLESEVAEV